MTLFFLIMAIVFLMLATILLYIDVVDIKIYVDVWGLTLFFLILYFGFRILDKLEQLL